MRQAARVYFETQVTTTSQGQVLIMLYDGAIKFLNQAKELIKVKDYAGKGKLISSAIDVINELGSSLNAEKGGDLAANLSQLYFYCNKRLFMANSRMDTGAIDEVIKILSGIRSAYAQIMDSPEAVEAMAQAAANTTAKAPRAPVGAQSGPASATPTPKAKAHNAYATQSATPAIAIPEAPASGRERTAPADSEGNHEPARAEPQKAASPQPELPVAESAAPSGASLGMPGMPDLDFDAETAPPPSLTQGKRITASNLYRKFAS